MRSEVGAAISHDPSEQTFSTAFKEVHTALTVWWMEDNNLVQTCHNC